MVPVSDCNVPGSVGMMGGDGKGRAGNRVWGLRIIGSAVKEG